MQKTAAAGLYEQDFALWIEGQLAVLRRGVLEGQLRGLDVEHVIEELEGLGNSQRDSLQSYLTTLIFHLLKLEHQPEHASRSWLGTIVSRANRIRRILRRSPSLMHFLTMCEEDAYADARLEAAAETGIPLSTFPERMQGVLQLRLRLALDGEDFG